jgi:hypothetical protein
MNRIFAEPRALHDTLVESKSSHGVPNDPLKPVGCLGRDGITDGSLARVM